MRQVRAIFTPRLDRNGASPPRRIEARRGKPLLPRELDEDVGQVFALGNQEAVWDLGRNVNDVSGAERVAFPALDARADIFAWTAPGLETDHFSSQLKRALAALHEHDIDDVVVLFGKTIGIAIEQTEAMALVVGQRLPGGMIGTHFLGERFVPLL